MKNSALNCFVQYSDLKDNQTARRVFRTNLVMRTQPFEQRLMIKFQLQESLELLLKVLKDALCVSQNSPLEVDMILRVVRMIEEEIKILEPAQVSYRAQPEQWIPQRRTVGFAPTLPPTSLKRHE